MINYTKELQDSPSWLTKKELENGLDFVAGCYDVYLNEGFGGNVLDEMILQDLKYSGGYSPEEIEEILEAYAGRA